MSADRRATVNLGCWTGVRRSICFPPTAVRVDPWFGRRLLVVGRVGDTRRCDRAGRFELASDRPWRFELLTPPETGRRNRRTIDGALILAGAIVVGGAAAIASSGTGPAPGRGGRSFAGDGLRLGGGGLARRVPRSSPARSHDRRRHGRAAALESRSRILGLALLLVTGAGLVVGGLVESDWFVIEPHLWSQWGFPELRVAWLAADRDRRRPGARATGPHTCWRARRARSLRARRPRFRASVACLGGSGTRYRQRSTRPSALRNSSGGTARAAGSGCVELARSCRGRADIVAAAAHRRGRVRRARLGRAAVRVRVLGRDAQDTQRLARRWRALAYRIRPGASPTAGSSRSSTRRWQH